LKQAFKLQHASSSAASQQELDIRINGRLCWQLINATRILIKVHIASLGDVILGPMYAI